MFVAMSPDLRVVNGSKDAKPDQDLLDKQEMHPSRIREFGRTTGLATMSKDNEPRVSSRGISYLTPHWRISVWSLRIRTFIGVLRG